MARFALLASFALLGSAFTSLSAQERKLWIQAADYNRMPVRGLQFSLTGYPGTNSGLTDVSGITSINLGANVNPGMSVDILINSKKYWICKWNQRFIVPPFGPANAIQVLVVELGKQVQIGPNVITLVAEMATATAVPAVISDRASPREQLKTKLEETANQWQVDVKGLESRIETFSSNDPYERGVVALLKGRYIEAADQLSTALQHILADPAANPERLVSCAFFLGHARYLLGDYRQAAEAYRRATATVPDDPALLTGLATALFKAEDFAGAESGLRRLLEMKEREIKDQVASPLSEQLATILTNLGYVLAQRNRCADAQPYFERAVAIWERLLLNSDVRLAGEYDKLGVALYCQGRYKEAAGYFERELKVWELAKGPEHPAYAEKLWEYAEKMENAGEYAIAEPAYKRSLDILEQKSPNRSAVIPILRALGRIRFRARDYVASERFYSRALREQTEASGDESRPQIGILQDLLVVYEEQHDAANQERCYRQLLAIRKKEPESRFRGRNIATLLASFATLLYNEGTYQEARLLVKEAEPWKKQADEPVQRRLDDLRDALQKIDQTSADRRIPK